MKTRIEEKHIPARIEINELYVCENCDDEWNSESNINKCPVCGEDACSNCGIKVELYSHYLEEPDSIYWYHTPNRTDVDCFDKNEEIYVHKDCCKKIRKNLTKYEKSYRKLLNNMKAELDKLNKEVFKVK